jgi:pilus assembly protein CpaF
LDESPDQLEKRVRQVLDDLLREFSPPSGCSAVAVKKEFCDDVLRYGPIQPLIEDESITEIMVNGPGMIYVERTGRLTETAARFRGNSHLINVIERIVAPLGRRIDESSPMVDARLPDGSRVNAVVPPLAIDGPLLTIRKFRKEGFTVQQLVDNGMFSPAMAVFFRACVSGRLNVLISGGTGSGKTTLLNTLSSFIPPTERIVTIEDSAELRLPQRHVARMEARPANIEGKGRVAIRDLVINALRMRPDRIVVGECRGGEALDMIQAMNTGHDGSLTTAHANTPRDALGRIEVMCLMAGMDLPMRAVREQIASAIQLIVQVQRFRDGSRRIAKVTELMGLQQDVYTLQDLFVYEETGVDKQGRDVGRHRPTGSVPAFREAVEARGEHIPFDLFKTSSPE